MIMRIGRYCSKCAINETLLCCHCNTTLLPYVQYLRNYVYVSFWLRLVTFTFGIWPVRIGHKMIKGHFENLNFSQVYDMIGKDHIRIVDLNTSNAFLTL